MAPRKFAQDSSVPVDRSRAEIRDLLAAWGCSGMGWTDHFAEGDVELAFAWDPAVVARMGKQPENCPGGFKHNYKRTCVECNWKDGFAAGDGTIYKVRMRLKIGTDAGKQRTVGDNPQKQRTAHRLLLLKIKADLNAAMAGLVKAEEVFLPYITDAHGNTIAEVVLPKLRAGYAALPAKTGGTP